MEQRIPITPEGFRMLEDKLKQLKKYDRPKIVEELATARAFGDLSENAEYDAARERHAMVEAKIAEIEHNLSVANIIDYKKTKSDRVVFGATVTLMDLDSEKILKYKIVGEFESDASNGKISVASPMARGLIGKNIGDEATVIVPAGTHTFEILKIEFI
ncbi:MAG TPA: transcription elongation factor GreA [bacterium]